MSEGLFLLEVPQMAQTSIDVYSQEGNKLEVELLRLILEKERARLEDFFQNSRKTPSHKLVWILNLLQDACVQLRMVE